MKIIVVGCGKIGSTIIASLTAEGHDVTAVDNNPEVIKKINNVYDVMGVCGNGADCDILEEAGVKNCELLVATSGSDELNMLSCFIAKRMGAKKTAARIRNPEYNDKSLGFMRQQLDLSLAINPEKQAANEIFNILRLPAAAKVETFSRAFEMVELKVKEDSPLCENSLMDIRKKYKHNFLVCAVGRGQDVIIPDGNFVIKSGDRLGITATSSEISKLLKATGLAKKQARDVIIVGASKTAYYLSKMLLSVGISVTIIEKDKNRCKKICALLPDATVINGDGAQKELLLESGLNTCDAFISLTGMDEENILISYFASTKNVPSVVTKVNREEFLQTANKIGLDCVISPRSVISDVMVRYARALHNSMDSNVETLYKLMDGKIEALEFLVQNDFSEIGKPLKDIKLKSNIIVTGIIRGRKVIIPTGDDQILAKDRVVVIAAGRRINNISEIVK